MTFRRILYPQFRLCEPPVRQDRQRLPCRSDPVRMDLAKQQIRCDSGACHCDAQRVNHHAAPDIPGPTLSDGRNIAGVFQRPRGDHDFPVPFLGRATNPGGWKGQQIRAIKRQPSRQLRETHIITGHQTDIDVSDPDQCGHFIPGHVMIGFLHGEGVIQMQLAICSNHTRPVHNDLRIIGEAGPGRHGDTADHRQIRPLKRLHQTGHKRTIQRLRCPYGNAEVFHIRRDDAFRQHQQFRAFSGSAFSESDALRKIGAPFGGHRKLTKSNFHR